MVVHWFTWETGLSNWRANKGKIGIRSHDCSRRQRRDELLDWMNDLHLVDCWHFQHPALQEFTSPTGTSRIDYVFVNYRLFRSTFQNRLHDSRAKSGTGNHIGLSFRLVSACFKPPRRAPWKCIV